MGDVLWAVEIVEVVQIVEAVEVVKHFEISNSKSAIRNSAPVH
jgi:hypothetical protein